MKLLVIMLALLLAGCSTLGSAPEDLIVEEPQNISAPTPTVTPTLAPNAESSSKRLRRVPNKSVIQTAASKPSIDTLVAFFDYIKNYEPDIRHDETAKAKWLTKSLQKSMNEFNARESENMRQHPDDKPEYADNASFTGVWNQPTTYSIISARQYDYRNADNPDGLLTIFDVLYEWGHEQGLENQYPGERSLQTYIFLHEDGLWKLDDIYGFGGEFASAESLRQYLEKR